MRKQMIALAALCPLTVFAVSPVHNRVIDYARSGTVCKRAA